MKGDDATLVAAFLRMKRENFQPARDLILALTADEEGGSANGADWLVKRHRGLIDAQFCGNTDAGGGHIKNGKPIFMAMQAAEKVFLSFKLEVTNSGGHSSLPTRDNAIYHLADGLSRLAKFDFPVHLFDVTRAAFERGANIYSGELGADLKTMGQNPQDAAAIARLSPHPLYHPPLRPSPHRGRRPRPPLRHSLVQRPTAHHLRGHHAFRGPRPERAPPTRHRRRQLPLAARR